MSEIKRIQLTTISDVKKNSSDLNILSPSSSSKTTRYEINVDLFEPNTKSFPEFNYKKLLHAVKKKHKKCAKSPPNGLSDPFEDNDDDVERIAREFEKKYGGVNNSYSGGGKKSNRPKITTDLCDKGAGYDDNDSFIDNTEAYDELIPEEVDTVSGGFYINSGALEFKHLSNFERPEDAHKMPKPRKRVLSTSSSSSESSDENDDEPDENNHDSSTDNNVKVTSKPKNNGNSDKKIKLLNVSTSDEEKQSKLAPPPAKPITKDKDKKVKKDKKDEVLTGSVNVNVNNNDSVNSNTNASSSNNNNNNNSGNNNNVTNNANSSDRDKQIKTTTVKDMLRAKRDSILGLKENAVKGDNDGNDEESTNSSLSSSSSNEPQSQQQSNAIVNSNIITAPPATIPKSPHANTNVNSIEISAGSTIKLPPNVSADLIKSVEELREISQKHTQSGAKTNFFDAKTMDVIMKIDTETRNGDSASRTSVFQYIEHLVPFTQKTIMGHIRKVRVQNEENKLAKYYNKLKSAVDLVLPTATEAYKEECQKVNQIRSTMPSDDKITTNVPKMPRKRFPWNDNTRKLLFDLYTALKLSYNIVKPRKETVDSFIENYYKTKLIGLWPPGWMRVEELNKEIERRKLGVKKPKENKKPADKAGSQPVNSVNSTTNLNNTSINTAMAANQCNMVVDAVNNVTTKESINNTSKSILSTNNTFTTATKLVASQSSHVTNTNNNDKMNTAGTATTGVAAISTSNSNQIYSKIDKTESNYDINKKSSSGNTSNQVSNSSTINLTNSLTITPVKTTGSASSTSKPLPSVENKVTITNVETSTTPNSTNHHSSNMSSVLKPELLKSTKQLSSSSIINNNLVTKNSSISSSKQQSSSNLINISPAGSTINASNMLPPITSTTSVRKTSDYSINSIMSTSTSSSTTGSNSLNLNSGHSNSYPSTKTSSSTVISVTEICNINNKVNETIENAIKSKSNSNTSNHHINNSNSNHNNNNNSLGHSDSLIKVRSVANMNNSIRDNTSSNNRALSASQTISNSIQQQSAATRKSKKLKKIIHNSDDDYDDGDSDSSDVEIVDVFQARKNKPRRESVEIVDIQYNKPQQQQQQQQSYTQSSHHQKKNIMINKNKYNKNNFVEPKLNNYISNSHQKMLNTKKEDSNMNKLNHQNTIDNDLDVSQVMKDLKELQALQQPKYTSVLGLDNNLIHSKQNQHSSGYEKTLKDSADTNKRSSKNS